MARKSRGRGAGPVNEEPPGELDFTKGDERGGRAGDLRSDADVRNEFPPAREREAGMTAGETADGEVTADDLAPETLLDEDRSRSPHARAKRSSADTLLRDAGEAEIGAGRGKDEAELAQEQGGEGEDSGGPAEEGDFRKRRDAAREGRDADDYGPREARAGDPERERRRGG